MIRIAVLPGDGIGAEVLAGPLDLLEELAARGYVTWTGPWPVGASAYMDLGEGLPRETVAACEDADAILFGAVGDHPGFQSGSYRPEMALLSLREYFDLRISIRQIWRGTAAPLTIVRNLLGGAYGGARFRQESEDDGPASDLVQLDPRQIREVVGMACDHAVQASTSLISVDKANLLATSRLWRRVAGEVAAARGLGIRHVYVDRFAFELAKFDLPDAIVVTEGLFGDILSDLATARAGSIALCSSASIHPGTPHRGRCVGLFEPVHGTGPDIAGLEVANPVGAYLALAAALEWFPATAFLAGPLRAAVEQALSAGPRTVDLARPGEPIATTGEFAMKINVRFRSLLSP